MPKPKTKKAAKRRVKITSGDKVLRGDACMSHLKTKKRSKRLRRKSGLTVASRSDAARLRKLLPGT